MSRFDMSELEWNFIQPILPNKVRGVARVDDKRVINGIFYKLRTGVPWRDLPERYYKALRRTQTTLKKEIPNWEPWIGFFLRCLKKQKINLAAKVEKEKEAEDTDLPILSIQILQLLKQHQRLTISEIVQYTEANQNTLKVRLRELVSSGRVKRHGKARATWYSQNT